MNTSHTNFANGDQSMKLLFRQLFFFQIQLEHYSFDHVTDDLEVQELIQTIDLLMEIILNNRTYSNE